MAVSLKQLQDFHKIDRIAYARLLRNFDPSPSIKIVAFWNTLEKFGFRNFVFNLQQFSDSSFLSLAKESILCLQCLSSSSQQITPWLCLDFPEMNRLVPQETLLGFLVKNREGLKRMVHDFVKDVCRVAFLDIVQQNLGRKQSSKNPNGAATDYHKGKILKGNVDSESEEKTLFMTFSRGHPVSSQEIHGFIVGKFGTSVEAIYMDKNPMRLFACVVLRSHSDMSRVLGGKTLVKLFINGKQVRVRRFVPKP